MRYLGGKSRIAKHIVEQITKKTTSKEVWEPFCGGAAVTLEFARKGFKVHASDTFPGLCNMHKASCNGFRLPMGCTDEMRREAKYKTDPFAIALRFGLGFGGNYSSGIARPPDLYATQFNRHCERLTEHSESIEWKECDYRAVSPTPGNILYCDPPYKGTTEYEIKGFDHDIFWDWVRSQTLRGVHVFMSEFSATLDIECVWSLERKVGIDNRHKCQMHVEKLFFLGGKL